MSRRITTTVTLISPAETLPAVAVRPDPDDELVKLWLHGKSAHTRRGYGRDLARFRTFVGCRLADVDLALLQDYADSLADLAPASRRRSLAAVKSLYSFAAKTRLFPVNVAAALAVPHVENVLAERILSEDEIKAMIAGESNPRNRTLLRVLYAAGIRCAEACALKWRNVQSRGETVQLSIFGKGSKTRHVLLNKAVAAELPALKGNAGPDAPVFRSRKKQGHLDESAVWRIVRAAAVRAGIDKPVSPHWTRHAHATHALDRGAPLPLVQETLGHASIETTRKYLHVRPGDSSSKYLDLED